MLPPYPPCSLTNPQRLGLPKRSPSVSKMLEQWVLEHEGTRPIHRWGSGGLREVG